MMTKGLKGLTPRQTKFGKGIAYAAGSMLNTKNKGYGKPFGTSKVVKKW